MEKQAIRERIWDKLEEDNVARFPYPPHGRIPNFKGASDAAERLAETDVWRAADAVKCNPDAPQRPVRKRALTADKTLYMAVPRLSDRECFLKLDPNNIDDIDDATTISGSSKHGVPVTPSKVDPIDVIVSGSVAVSESGDRIGKGEGFSDLEYALLREFDRVSTETTVATTVHDLQVVREAPSTALDVPIDLICTPTQTVTPSSQRRRPEGIEWTALNDERLEEIPILANFRR